MATRRDAGNTTDIGSLLLGNAAILGKENVTTHTYIYAMKDTTDMSGWSQTMLGKTRSKQTNKKT